MIEREKLNQTSAEKEDSDRPYIGTGIVDRRRERRGRKGQGTIDSAPFEMEEGREGLTQEMSPCEGHGGRDMREYADRRDDRDRREG